jgi:hypothetical protein
MKNMTYIGAIILASFIITGCSHSIQISPNLDTLRTQGSAKSSTIAGYYISQEDLMKEVTTPGGGGDKVKYFPYKDTEAALKTILATRFAQVYSLKSATSDPLIKEKNIRVIFTPKITTESSSESAFTWPPTDFKIELTCTAMSPEGKKTWEKTVVGKGHAEFDEFKSDFSLSAKRATQEAFTLMRDEILSQK